MIFLNDKCSLKSTTGFHSSQPTSPSAQSILTNLLSLAHTVSTCVCKCACVCAQFGPKMRHTIVYQIVVIFFSIVPAIFAQFSCANNREVFEEKDIINFTNIDVEEDFKNQLRHGVAEARRPMTTRWWKPQQTKQRHQRAATARLERLWDYGVIPYEIEANFTGKWPYHLFTFINFPLKITTTSIFLDIIKLLSFNLTKQEIIALYSNKQCVIGNCILASSSSSVLANIRTTSSSPKDLVGNSRASFLFSLSRP